MRIYSKNIGFMDPFCGKREFLYSHTEKYEYIT